MLCYYKEVYAYLSSPVASSLPPHLLPEIVPGVLPALPPQPCLKIILRKLDLHLTHSPSGPVMSFPQNLTLPVHLTLINIELTQQSLFERPECSLNVIEARVHVERVGCAVFGFHRRGLEAGECVEAYVEGFEGGGNAGDKANESKNVGCREEGRSPWVRC